MMCAALFSYEIRRILSIVVLTVFHILQLSCNEQDGQKITIAAAANMQYAIRALAVDFTNRTDIQCDLVISSSGKLTAQIMEGAPYDIFLAANMKYPEYLYSNNMAANSPKIYAYGKLILWTTDPDSELSIDILTDSSVGKIAIANPKTAPYGEAAMEVLENMDIMDSISDKLVYGESIAQTNQFVTTEAVEFGFTALSVVLSEPLRGKGKWIVIPEDQYNSIEQGVVIIKHDKGVNQLSQRFFTYLFSEEAGKILEEFGYSRSE